MKTRLIKNYATTILGIAVWIYTAVLMHKAIEAGQDIQEVGAALWPYMGLGTLLLRSKDSLIGLAPKE